MKPHVENHFGEVTPAMLYALARRHFVEGVPTVKLMSEAHNDTEKAAVLLVAFMSLSQADLEKCIRTTHNNYEHLVACCRETMEMLRREGVPLH
jgi:hypothetical protein